MTYNYLSLLLYSIARIFGIQPFLFLPRYESPGSYAVLAKAVVNPSRGAAQDRAPHRPRRSTVRFPGATKGVRLGSAWGGNPVSYSQNKPGTEAVPTGAVTRLAIRANARSGCASTVPTQGVTKVSHRGGAGRSGR